MFFFVQVKKTDVFHLECRGRGDTVVESGLRHYRRGAADEDDGFVWWHVCDHICTVHTCPAVSAPAVRLQSASRSFHFQRGGVEHPFRVRGNVHAVRANAPPCVHDSMFIHVMHDYSFD